MLPLLLPGLVLAWRIWLGWAYGSQIYSSVEHVPPRQVALVFGAGILRNNRPTPALADRVEAAAALYHAGKVRILLMTGDNRFVDYNEPAVMRQYALELGVPDEAIVLDYAGRRTYDSCYRARAIFQVEEAVLVTQKFHQARAAYLCQQLGVRPVGFVADNRSYRRRVQLWWNLRETVASSVAWWDVTVSRPVPVLGEILPIGK